MAVLFGPVDMTLLGAESYRRVWTYGPMPVSSS